MNPYDPPKQYTIRRGGGIHGVMAAVLLVTALVLRFGVPVVVATGSVEGGGLLLGGLSVAGSILWVWGCCHLAVRFGLSGFWGLAGVFFLLGLGLIFWVSKQKPKWDREVARRSRERREYRGDPNSPY
jgi:hypothetical protein